MVIPILSTVLAILVVLALRQLLALRLNVRRAGGLAEGWAALQAQQADGLTETLLRLHKAQQHARPKAHHEAAQP
jgi:hypothetical protein